VPVLAGSTCVHAAHPPPPPCTSDPATQRPQPAVGPPLLLPQVALHGSAHAQHAAHPPAPSRSCGGTDNVCTRSHVILYVVACWVACSHVCTFGRRTELGAGESFECQAGTRGWDLKKCQSRSRPQAILTCPAVCPVVCCQDCKAVLAFNRLYCVDTGGHFSTTRVHNRCYTSNSSELTLYTNHSVIQRPLPHLPSLRWYAARTVSEPSRPVWLR
jgi:hypothetical protein